MPPPASPSILLPLYRAVGASRRHTITQRMKSLKSTRKAKEQEAKRANRATEKNRDSRRVIGAMARLHVAFTPLMWSSSPSTIHWFLFFASYLFFLFSFHPSTTETRKQTARTHSLRNKWRRLWRPSHSSIHFIPSNQLYDPWKNSLSHSQLVAAIMSSRKTRKSW